MTKRLTHNTTQLRNKLKKKKQKNKQQKNNPKIVVVVGVVVKQEAIQYSRKVTKEALDSPTWLPMTVTPVEVRAWPDPNSIPNQVKMTTWMMTMKMRRLQQPKMMTKMMSLLMTSLHRFRVFASAFPDDPLHLR